MNCISFTYFITNPLRYSRFPGHFFEYLNVTQLTVRLFRNSLGFLSVIPSFLLDLDFPSGMNGYYRNGPRFDRIDQDEVPESKHTVFIRGLPGHIKTDEVK